MSQLALTNLQPRNHLSKIFTSPGRFFSAQSHEEQGISRGVQPHRLKYPRTCREGSAATDGRLKDQQGWVETSVE